MKSRKRRNSRARRHISRRRGGSLAWRVGVKLFHAFLAYVAVNVALNVAVIWTRPFDPTSLVELRHFENRVLATYFLGRHLAWHDDWMDERDIPGVVKEVAAEQEMDPALLQALVDVESSGRPHVVSPVGACGLTQLMPRTALELGVDDPFDPRENLAAGASYLMAMKARFGGDLSLALAAYNAGPGAVEANRGIPSFGETRSYVRRVLRRFAQLSGHASTR